MGGGLGAGSAQLDRVTRTPITEETAMPSTCECALLHAQRSQGRGCQDCGTACCPSCAVEIESHTYCRWCAMALSVGVPA